MSDIMTTKKKRPSMISFRASAEEIARIDALVKKLRRKYSFMNKSDVLRDLVGLTQSGLITAEMRASLLDEVIEDLPTHKRPSKTNNNEKDLR